MALNSSFFGSGSTANAGSMSPILSAISMQQNIRDNSAYSALSSGITLMEKKKYDKAVAAFKQASALKPDLTEAYTFLGDAYVRLGKQQQAVDTYKLSLKVDRTQDKLYTNLANLYIDLKRPADAEKILQDGIKQNKLHTLAHYTLGQLMAQRGDYKSAESRFRDVIKLEPKDGNGYYALGMALNGQGKYDDAITQLQKAITLKKDFVPAQEELGKAYLGTDDTYRAQLQVDKLKAIGTQAAQLAATELEDLISKPGFYSINSNGTLPLALRKTSLTTLEPGLFNTANASKDYTVKLSFKSAMDAESVTNIANWSISRASGGYAGFYNGLYSPTNVPVPSIPKQVTYDPVNMEATLTFSLTQNATVNGTVDPSHIVFKFNGVDVQGKSMDPDADEINGSLNTPY